MKQKIQKIIILSIVMIISVTFLRCQKDDDSSNQQQSKIQTVTLDEAKKFLTNSKTNSFGKSANNKFENLEFDKISQEKINGTNQLLTVIPLATNNNLQNDRVLLLKVENEIKSVVFTMYPDENSVIGSFSGTLFSYSLDGNFISGYRAKNGVIISYFVEKNTVNSTSGKAIRLNEVVVENNYQLVYALDMFGSYSLFGNNNMYGGGYNDYNGVDYYSWDAGGSSGISAPTPEAIAAAIQKQIYADKLPSCLKNILNDLIKIDTGPGNMINKFSGNDPSFNYNWTMGEGSNNYNVAGNTLISTYNPTTGISSTFDIKQFPNATELSWAKTILHESVHAYLITYFNQNEPGFKADYPVLFQKFMETKLWNANHHEEIAQSIMKSFGEALESYGISKGYKLDKQFYQDMAWGGLENTDAFKKLPITDQRRISSTIGIELTGEDYLGNKKTPKGKKAGC